MNPLLIHLTIAISSLTLGISIGWLLRGAVNEESKEKKRGKDFFISLGMVLLALVSLAGLTVAIFQYREATTCQAEYNKNFTSAIVERQSATDSDRAASRALAQGTLDMLNTILNPASNTDQRKGAVEQYREVYQDYLKSSQESDVTRKLNPLPIIPSCATKD